MTLWIVLIIFQFLSVIIFAPINIGVKLYFSLNKETSIIICRVFGINFLRIRINNVENHIVLTINGKNLTKKFVTYEKLHLGKLPKLLLYLTNEKLINFVYALGMIGGNDALSCAIKMSAINILLDMQKTHTTHRRKRQILLKPDYKTNRLDFNLLAHVRVNLFQIAEILSFVAK